MKQLFTILILLISLTAKAQVVAVKDTVAVITIKSVDGQVTKSAITQELLKDTTKIEIPAWVAKQIALDLTSGDSAKAALKVTQNILDATNKKVAFQDSLIKVYVAKNQTYAQQILTYKEKEKKYIEYTKTLKSDVKKAKFKNRLATGVGTLAGLAGLLLLFIAN
jgi:GMP synthase PP-ATPase subunit